LYKYPWQIVHIKKKKTKTSFFNSLKWFREWLPFQEMVAPQFRFSRVRILCCRDSHLRLAGTRAPQGTEKIIYNKKI
jgi:hypothetical protein